MSGEEKMRKYEKELRRVSVPTTHVSGSGKVHIDGVGDIQVSGSGFVSPQEIKISGSGRLPGGLKTERLKCAGSVSIEGDIEAEEMDFSGSASIAGSVKAKSLSASGSFSVDGSVQGLSLKVAGSSRIGGAIELENALHVLGSFRVSGDVRAGKYMELRGKFDIGGKIVTDDFKAELDRHESYARDGIEAVNVEIKKRDVEGVVIFGIPIFGIVSRYGKLYASDIIAKEKVYLENVCCENVIGKDVTISGGCIIKGSVKYSNTISVHPKAKLANPPEKIDLKG
ncbi:MAG: polymer-forming cytoskeletal protein [Candidatus Bathyarchaeia archaeon]